MARLLDDPGEAWNLTPEEARELLPRAAGLYSVLATRAQDSIPTVTFVPKTSDRWLKVSQVAELLGRDKRWVYRRARGWPFTRKEGRSLVFSERGGELLQPRRLLDAQPSLSP